MRAPREAGEVTKEKEAEAPEKKTQHRLPALKTESCPHIPVLRT